MRAPSRAPGRFATCGRAVRLGSDRRETTRTSMSASLTSRRGFLGVAASVAAGLLVPKGAFAQPLSPRLLRFDHLHTGEKLAIEYWKGGTYEPQSLDAINHLMRDFRTGDVYPIDPPLLDLLHDLAEATGTRRPFEIISAYRSPSTNALLHQHSDMMIV